MAVDLIEPGQSAGRPWRTKVLPTQRRAPTCGLLVGGGLVVLALLVGATSSGWSIRHGSPFILLGSSTSGGGRNGRHTQQARVPIPFNCTSNGTASAFPTCHRAATTTCPSPPPSSFEPPAACPEYFRYMDSDLSPWHAAGITRAAVERARGMATFRLVVAAGRAFVERYRPAFQTRDVFTLWGVLQLLARYPGRVPDLDLMFLCDDTPAVRAAAYDGDPSAAPPLFAYCKDDASLGVVFPDWTFWGWPEVNVRPWAPFLEEVAREARRVPWRDRAPYAFWKGNPDVGAQRGDLMRCSNGSGGGGEEDWNAYARLVRQDWEDAGRNGFRGSDPAEQCAYRYKIYVQGRTWSVSQKYILACGSPVLRVDSPFHDFFSRGLVAGRHYWRIDAARMCPAIRLAVGWGNAHPAEAQRVGEEGGGFARDKLSMDRVYDYMLHLLTRYARLLRYTPTVPENATELCLESMACPADGRAREFMMASMEKNVADREPCTMPPPSILPSWTEGRRQSEKGRAQEWKET